MENVMLVLVKDLYNTNLAVVVIVVVVVSRYIIVQEKARRIYFDMNIPLNLALDVVSFISVT